MSVGAQTRGYRQQYHGVGVGGGQGRTVFYSRDCTLPIFITRFICLLKNCKGIKDSIGTCLSASSKCFQI